MTLRTVRIVALLVAAAVVVVTLFSVFVGDIEPEQLVHMVREDGRVNVVTSIHPITCIVREVGGTRTEVHTLLPPGGSAHLHEVSPADMQVADTADLGLRIGGDLDEWAEDILQRVGEDVSVELVDEARAGSAGDSVDWSNPHVWLDPVIVRDHLVPVVRRKLCRVDPDGCDHYVSNADSFRRQLTRLHGDLRDMLTEIRGRGFISDHAAWSHFARRYGLIEVGVIECTPGYEAGPRELSGLLQAAEAQEVQVVTTTRGHGTMLAETVADEVDGHVVELDPIGDPDCADRDTYSGLLRFNAARLVWALRDGEVGHWE